MIEALWYGIVASLTFIGFISIVYLVVLHIYKPKNNGRFVLFIPPDATNEEVFCLIYGAYIRNVIFGSLEYKEILVLDDSIDDEMKESIIELSENLSSIQFVSISNLSNFFESKEKNGTGAY